MIAIRPCDKTVTSAHPTNPQVASDPANQSYSFPVAKQLTREKAERKRLQAAAFMERIGEPDRAEEFRSMTADQYAAHRGVTLTNPQNLRRRTTMAAVTTTSKSDLQSRIDDAIDTLDEAYAPESNREDLAQAVGDALDILRGEDEEEDEDLDDENGDDLD